MEQYDTNGDGAVAGGELENAPGLKAAQSLIDSDADGRITGDEVAERVRAWQSSQAAVMPIRCRVSLEGRPVPGVVVRFDPEPFLGDDIRLAVGTTNIFGEAMVSVPKEERPSDDYPSGVQLGLYRVRLTYEADSGKKLPARYNSDTILGQEVSYDDPAVANNRVIFTLRESQAR